MRKQKRKLLHMMFPNLLYTKSMLLVVTKKALKQSFIFLYLSEVLYWKIKSFQKI